VWGGATPWLESLIGKLQENRDWGSGDERREGSGEEGSFLIAIPVLSRCQNRPIFCRLGILVNNGNCPYC